MELQRAGRILATKSSRSCKHQPRQRPRILSLCKSWQKEGERDDRAAEGCRRNSNRFILDVETPASLLIQDSNSTMLEQPCRLGSQLHVTALASCCLNPV